MEKDGQLIHQFNDSGDEQAFAALVKRHVNMVFATAFRQLDDFGIAEEVTQNVFVALAQSAGKLGRHPTLAGWLYQTTLNKTRERLRSELRRRRREQIAVNWEEVRMEGDSVWSSVVPLLDEALLELHQADRLAVIMHFMESHTFSEVGATLGVGEDAARKRVQRCLDQLTRFFRQRGFVVPALAASAPLFAMSSQAAPSGLAKSAVTAGLKAGRMTAGSSTLTFIKGALRIMAWSKAKTAIVAGVVVLFAAGTATVTVKEIQEHRTYPWQEGKLLDRDKLDQVPPQVRILPQKSHAVPNGWASNPNKKIIGLGVDFKIMIQAAYAFTYGTKRLTRILPLVELPPGHFDFISTLPSGSPEALQQEIRRKFGLVAELETKETDVLLLTLSSGNAPGLKPTANGGYSIDSLRMLLEDYFQVPVLDQTGLAGNFDMEAKWNRPFKGQNQDALKRDLLDQLGIELVPSRESVEMLVVEKAK